MAVDAAANVVGSLHAKPPSELGLRMSDCWVKQLRFAVSRTPGNAHITLLQ
jgi:hypothetical protein